MTPSDDAQIGIVILVEGDAVCLAPLIDSLLDDSEETRPYAVLVSMSACMEGGVSVCHAYAAAYPDRLHHVPMHETASAPQARNAGIFHLLQTCPTVEIMIFCSMRDRIVPGSLRKTLTAFHAARAQAEADGTRLGWVRPAPEGWDSSTRVQPASPGVSLWDLAGVPDAQPCTFSADLFRSGLRYDEGMKWGGETWELTIAAAKAGFVGSPESGLPTFRQAPGPRNEPAQSDKAREHNRTLIRLRHPEMFRREHVWERWHAEHAHYALLAPEGWQAVRGIANFQDVLTKTGRDTPHASLAHALHATITDAQSPCPQRFCVLARDQHGVPLLTPEQVGRMLQWTAPLTARGHAVAHGGMEGIGDPFFPDVAPVSSPAGGELLRVLARAQLLALLREPDRELENHIHLRWPLEGFGPAPEAADMEPRSTARGAISTQLRDATAALRDSGYAFCKPHRFTSRKPEGQDLEWANLPGFLIGVPTQVLHDTAYLRRRMVLCHARYLKDMLRAVQSGEISEVDIMLDARDSIDMDPEDLRILHTHPEIGDVHVWRHGQVLGMALDEVFLNFLGLYGEVIHWRSTGYARHLANLQKIGVRNTLMVTSTDLAAQALNFSSMFKCYDRYVELTRGQPFVARSQHLSARGVPRLRQGQEKGQQNNTAP